MIKLYVSGFAGNFGTKVLIEEKQDELLNQFNKEFITHIKNQIEETLSKDGFNPSLIMSYCEQIVGASFTSPYCRGEHSEPDELCVVDFETNSKRRYPRRTLETL